MTNETLTGSDAVLDVAIVGAGFAGLCMAIRLEQAGETSFAVFEQAGSVGGTWRDNTYPGAACDVQSHLYSFSFEPNPYWSHMFARQTEILAYLQHCTDKYGIERHIRFDTAVVAAAFDAVQGVWTVALSDGSSVLARTLVSGTGGLSRPSYPAIAGLDQFDGALFHSARWDHDCELDGKRVAVIGTGASAIQVVPQLQRRASSLAVFQRSAAWVMPKDDRTIGALEQAVYQWIPGAQTLRRLALYWRLEARALAFVTFPNLMQRFQRIAQNHITESVPDPTLRAKLTPDYTIGCKRILLANDYYPAMSSANVDVVTEPIESISPTGIATADGAMREVDAIVLCTGFRAADDLAPFPITGLGGADLGDSWRDGAEAYLGTTVTGFPNLFMLVGPNTGLGHNSMVFMIESQVNYVMSSLQALRRRRLRYMHPRRDVQSKFNETLQSRMDRTVWTSGCSSWYQAETGKITTLWPGYTAEFRARTWRVDLRDYDCAPAVGRSWQPATHSTADPRPSRRTPSQVRRAVPRGR